MFSPRILKSYPTRCCRASLPITCQVIFTPSGLSNLVEMYSSCRLFVGYSYESIIEQCTKFLLQTQVVYHRWHKPSTIKITE